MLMPTLVVDVARQQGDLALSLALSVGGGAPGITAVFGPSGAGKSSLLTLIAGLQTPDRGMIRLGGRTLFSRQAGQAAAVNLPPEQRRLGLVFQESRLFPHLSVRNNLLFGWRLCPPVERRLTLDPVAEMLGLTALLDRRPASLSGGERQRVAVGRALLSSPHLMLMDEPLAALDGARKGEILPFLARLPQDFGIPVLYVTHAMDEVLRLADELVLINHGQVAAQGPVEAVLNRRDLWPLTGQQDPATVLAAAVEETGADGIRVRTAAGPLWIGTEAALGPMMPGQSVRVRIFARDVALALERPQAISTRNIVAATVSGLEDGGGGSVDATLTVAGDGHLTARITRAAVRDLRLEAGRPVFALIKAASLTRGGMIAHSS